MSLPKGDPFDFHKRFAESLLPFIRVCGEPYSLLKLTQRCILKNKKFFCDMADSQSDSKIGRTNPFTRISKTMKKELVEKEFKMQENAEDAENIELAELQCRMLQLLLNNKITTLHFPPGLDSDSQTAASALCRSIDVEQMPDMHTIVRKCLFDRCWDVKPFFSTFQKFPNLEVLQLARLECDNAELCTIAETLPKLRVLEVLLSDKVDRQGISALLKLNKLEGFFFCNENSVTEHSNMALCFELLPHLQSIYEDPDLSSFERLSKLTEEALSSITEPCTLQLRQLAVSSVNCIPVHVSLPELQVFYLSGMPPEDGVLSSSRFPKLTELNTFEVRDEGELYFLLGDMGKQLETLHVGIFADSALEQMIYGAPDLGRMLDNCPNLKELFLCSNIGPISEAGLRPETLLKLQTVVFYISCSLCSKLDSNLLQQILQLAPNLRNVRLKSVTLGKEDLEDLVELLKQNSTWSISLCEEVHGKLESGDETFEVRRLPEAAFTDVPSDTMLIEFHLDV